MDKLNITEGEWESFGTKVIVPNDIVVHCRNRSDATIIADAGITYQRTGKLPSELHVDYENTTACWDDTLSRLKQDQAAIKELVECLTLYRKLYAGIPHPNNPHHATEVAERAYCLINKHGER